LPRIPELAIVPEMESPVSQSTAWRTDPGLVRSHNEDFVAVYEPATEEDLERHGRLYIVADGVGGADAGEVASRYASERALHHYLAAAEVENRGERLLEAMQAANTDLRRLASGRDDSRRMATTMVAAVVENGRAYIGNVGDSRAYLLHNGELEQITQDQSLVAQLLQEGALTAEEAARYPYKNIILYSIGSEKRPPIDLYEVSLAPGDFLLLCSDGLTRHVGDDEIRDITVRESPQEATEILVGLARERGGEDNITVAVVGYGMLTGEPALATAGKASTPLVMPATTMAMPGTERQRSLWSFTIFLTLVMIVLIVLLWIFIQRATLL
jgi:PPM family protein phosphatase